MIIRFSVFKKLFIVVGLFVLFGVVVLLVSVVFWDVGDVLILFDLNFILVISICVEDCDYSFIGNSNYFQFNWFGYNVVINVIYLSGDVWVLVNGSYLSNGDLGNLVYDFGEVFLM